MFLTKKGMGIFPVKLKYSQENLQLLQSVSTLEIHPQEIKMLFGS
jgi:hypothetical protein